jgi:hypothetical protein
MNEYLVMHCDEDYNRKPVCTIQEKDLNKYGYGYEIYKIQEGNGKLKLHKKFDVANNSGFCVVLMHGTENRNKWDILEKYSTDSRKDFVKTPIFKKWCKKYFYEDFKEIRTNVLHTGCHCGEELEKNLDYAITQFEDNLIYYPY